MWVNTLCTILFIAFTTKCGGVLLSVQCILCGSWIARINSRIRRQHRPYMYCQSLSFAGPVAYGQAQVSNTAFLGLHFSLPPSEPITATFSAFHAAFWLPLASSILYFNGL